MAGEAAVAFAKDNGERFVGELLDLLRIPSISTDPERILDVRRAAEFCATELRRIGLHDVRLIETSTDESVVSGVSGPGTVVPGRIGHPLVLASWLDAGPDKPTVLMYGHYDVQPAEPLDEWNSPPFEPQIRNGNVYARGAVDDKGQMWMHIKALESLMVAGGGKLPVNVRVILEGEEEVGGEGIAAFVREHGDQLQADVALVSDTEMLGPGIPTLCVGLRGMIYTEIEARGARTDLHSGIYGGVAPNPFVALAQIIAKLKDENGTILIPGFYDNVLAPTEDELRAWAALPFDEEHYRETEVGSTALTGESGLSVMERTWARPTLDVHGMPGGFIGAGAKTVIPAKATAKVSMRLVPDMTPAKSFALYKAYVESICPRGIQLDIRLIHMGDPIVVSTDNSFVRTATAAMQTVFGAETVFVRGGGSIPIVGDFVRELGIPTLMMGFGLPDDNLHAPNEKFHLANFHQGIESIVRWLSSPDGLMDRAVSGYILAGGQSSRMGRNKALLELGGKPLVAHAVAKLHRLCGNVSILSTEVSLAPFAPLVSDLHPGCGPLGGIEAALDHASGDWSLILPVDVPFLPAAFIAGWVATTVREPWARASIFTVACVPHPTVLMIHRELKPCVEQAVARGEFKLRPVLESACHDLAAKHGVAPAAVFRNLRWENDSLLSALSSEGDPSWPLTEAQEASRDLWFANLNTPEEFAEAQRHVEALDL